jgi:hypothetical protein
MQTLLLIWHRTNEACSGWILWINRFATQPKHFYLHLRIYVDNKTTSPSSGRKIINNFTFSLRHSWVEAVVLVSAVFYIVYRVFRANVFSWALLPCSNKRRVRRKNIVSRYFDDARLKYFLYKLFNILIIMNDVISI